MAEVRPPAGLGGPGRALWRAVGEQFELERHEALLLTQAARVADRVAQLDEVVDVAGVLDEAGKAHPALVESRAQRLTLARLLAALRLPDQLDQRPQHRGIRGVYPSVVRSRGA